ncbi:hypothetical protein EZV62_003257 [Acer yangbiense]|uniref:YqgF/RNase H-like domain-containing protein n=1 Tax=Acer yangbiense TaxID=1000413 RepID=A0A5C7IHX9_9ROSI|nr:hypothetical protein EZV62_003257 [Acer yangbiense]
MKYVKLLKLYQELIKKNAISLRLSKWHRLICLDIRNECLNLAVSNPNNTIAMPLWLMKHKNPLDLYKEVFNKNLSRKPVNRGRLLGLDICDDHLALALSDTNLMFLSSSSKEWMLHGGAKLFGDLYHEDQDLKSLSAEVEALVNQHKVEGLVVGYPFRNQQEKSDYVSEGLKMARFINNLSNLLNFGGINFTYWDKTFTPKEIIIENHLELCMNRLVYDDFLLEPLVQRQRCVPHLVLQGIAVRSQAEEEMKYLKPLKLYLELIKKNPMPMRPFKRHRLLCLDICNKYLNLAVSNPDNTIAMPLCPMHRQENDSALMVDKFQTLISDYNVAGFVVRLPTDLSPTKHDPTITRQHVRDFVKELSKSRKLRGFKYAYWDDLATLKGMDFALKHHVEFAFEHLNLSEEVSKEIMDKLAATRVLQAYLDCVNTVVEIDKEKEYLVRRAWDEYVKEGSSMSIGLFPLGHVFQLMSRGDHVDSCLVMATKRHLGSKYGFPNVASQAGVLKTRNIKGVLIGTNDEAKFDGSEKKTKAFVENFEYDESEDFEEVLCACINERNTSNNAKNYIKHSFILIESLNCVVLWFLIKNSRRSMWMGFFAKEMVDLASAENDSASAENDLELYYQLIEYGKHLGVDMEGIFRYTYLKKEMIDSTSAGNNLEFYYQLIDASREKLFSDRFLDLDKDDNELSSLPLDSFSVELGRKRPLMMRVSPSAQIPIRPNPWFGFYDTFLKKN